MSSIRVSKRHKEAARLYLSGPPDVRGKWEKSCHRAGFKRAPDIQNKTSQAALERMEAETVEPVDDTLAELEMMLDGDATWEEVAPVARKVLTKIGAGLLEASQGQVTALKEIVARAEGRVGQQTKDDAPNGVVVLPALVDQDRIPYVEAPS